MAEHRWLSAFGRKKRVSGLTAAGVRLGRRCLTALADVVFPSTCMSCADLFPSSGNLRARVADDFVQSISDQKTNRKRRLDQLLRTYFCANCRQQVSFIHSPICPHCGTMFQSRQGRDHHCENCILQPPEFGIARAAVVFEGAMLEAIHRFKYKGAIQLALPLGALMFNTFLQQWQSRPVDLIVPVPLHSRRLKIRGFNQALLLLRSWDRWAKTAVGRGVSVCIDPAALVRKRDTDSQTGLGRRHRSVNVRNAFAVPQAQRVAGKRILLVDDVYTTGSTVRECTRVLRQNGVQTVDILTLARAD